jgi:hypothetical protein
LVKSIGLLRAKCISLARRVDSDLRFSEEDFNITDFRGIAETFIAYCEEADSPELAYVSLADAWAIRCVVPDGKRGIGAAEAIVSAARQIVSLCQARPAACLGLDAQWDEWIKAMTRNAFEKAGD